MILLPTLNRIEKLKNFVGSMLATKTSSPGLVITDHADYEMNKASYEALELPLGWEILQTTAISMGDKCREAWPLVKSAAWVMITNDDHFAVTPEWDKKLLAKLDGTNFTSANDRWLSPSKATTATAWSVPLLETLGWPIYPPCLQHLFIDDLWENLGRATGCWRPVMSAVVEHHHVLNGRGKDDETHQKVYSPKAWDHDKAVFDNFMKYDFADCVEKIKKLQNKTPSQRWNPKVEGKSNGLLEDKKGN